MSSYFPMFFNIEGKKFFVAGAGNIALRRINTLLSFGADIVVAADNAKYEIIEYANSRKLTLYNKKYEESMLTSDYFCVIAATNDDELNTKICNYGREIGIYVNNAADKSQCDFYFPAIVQERDIVAGVCASGKDHKLVRRVAAGMRSYLSDFISSDKNIN